MKKKIPVENFGEKKFYFQTNFNEVEKAKDKDGDAVGTIIRGYASTNDTDRVNDIIEPEAFADSVKGAYADNPIVLFQHKYDEPIGKATSLQIDSKGLYIEAMIVDDKIEPKLQAGILKAFSVGFRPIKEIYKTADGRLLDPDNWDDLDRIIWDDTVIRIIKEVELFEISIVSVPANATALFSLSKSVENYFDERKRLLIDKLKTMPKPKEEKKADEKIEEKDGVAAAQNEEAEKAEEKTDENDSEKVENQENSDSEKETVDENAESQTGEKDGESKGGEKNTDSDESTEEDGQESEDEKALGFKVTKKEVTKDNFVKALVLVNKLTEKVAELEEVIAKSPVNMAMAGGETFESKAHGASADPSKEGTIEGMSVKAWLNKKAGL